MPETWATYLRTGYCGRLGAAMRHNRLDLISLAALLRALDDAYLDPGKNGADIRSVARYVARNVHPDRALDLLQANASELEPPALLDLARLYRRKREWTSACAIWRHLARIGCREAVENLAKFYEHQRKDYRLAYRLACALPGNETAWRRQRRLRTKIESEPDIAPTRRSLF